MLTVTKLSHLSAHYRSLTPTLSLALRRSYTTTRFQSHYQILGLKSTATTAEIKKKYYELAKLYHPDASGDVGSGGKFNRIAVAYQVLTDENKRKQYDKANHYNKNHNQSANPHPRRPNPKPSHKQHPSRSQSHPQDPFPSQDPYFSSSRSYNKPKRGTDINLNLTITLQQSILGVSKQVAYTQMQTCEACADVEKHVCYACGGKREVFNRGRREKETCGECGGRGYENQCGACGGKSYVQRDVKNKVYVQKNTHNKTILRMEGLGNHGYCGGINGDLYVTVFVQQTNQLKIDGNNIHSEHHLDYLTAILGGQTTINTIYGPYKAKIQPQTQSGQQFRIFNYGLTSMYSKRKGDHIVTLRIRVPAREKLSQKQKMLMEQLQL